MRLALAMPRRIRSQKTALLPFPPNLCEQPLPNYGRSKRCRSVADYSDINGTAFKIDPALTGARILLKGIGGPVPATPPAPDGTGIPPGQYHGSISATYIEGSLATNDLVLYAIDEDINTAHILNDPNLAKNDRNSLWKWTIGGTPPVGGSDVVPTKVSNGVGGAVIGDFPAGGIVVDLAHGPDGKFYMAQIVRRACNQVSWSSIQPRETLS